MKSWDAIVIGAGIIGLSLALELNKHGMRVLVVEKGKPGREASWAAGGMLVDFPGETPTLLQELATASARMYPDFVAELQNQSGLTVDLRSVGTLIVRSVVTGLRPVAGQPPATTRDLPRPLDQLEPALSFAGTNSDLLFVRERCVDPRHLVASALAAARNLGVDFSCGDAVLSVEVADGKACGVRTGRMQFGAGTVVNCAGAWAGEMGPHSFPTRPVKGQMLCVVMPEKEMVRHVIRTPDVYLIPRSDGRMLIGATVEEAGFDKTTTPETIQRLRQSAVVLVPKLAEARTLEAWAGLRPGTPDGLPILGATATPGYFVATGHFRDGILLAPVTAKLMAQLMTGQPIRRDISSFSADRFAVD